MPLLPEEETLAEQAFYQGPAVLLEAGFTPEQAREFVERDDVQLKLLLLKREFDIHEGLKARAKFQLTRNLHRLIDGASAVLAQAIGGPVYARDASGHILVDAAGRPIMTRAEPSRSQLRAAKLVMDGVGVLDWRIRGDAATDPSTKLLFHTAEERTVEIEFDPMHVTEEARALSRERVRNAIESMTPKLTEVRETVKKSVGIDPASESAASKRKRKKKVSKVQHPTRKKKSATRRGKASG